MVKIAEEAHLLADGSIDLEAWLKHLNESHHYQNLTLIRNACVLSQLAGGEQATESGESCLQQGLAKAEILSDLEMDQATIAAAIISESVEYSDLSIEDVEEQLGAEVAKLVKGVDIMNAIHGFRAGKPNNHNQLDNMRKMLLAMVDDVRVVLIKLAEKLQVLRAIAHLSDSIQKPLAKEAMEIYAPLANRLGVGHIKWELEDLAFRYLESKQYKEIAKGLNARRVERDQYVKHIVTTLKEKLANDGIQHVDICGRSKHILSIYKKMQRKNVNLNEIYDATAVRILVDTIDDCYHALGIVHHLWQQIPEEYDDYIQNPKGNGYRSLHTAVIGPEQRNFEVQIRTYQMHDEAELGVAAHWKYKEGAATAAAAHERKIEWLREVLAWQKEVAKFDDIPSDIETEYFEERVYVFTPNGDILDLPQGATPIDFAYHIHSQVGHRCRGAKVDGHIVPLTYHLKTGEQVEILTTKIAKPTRDWLNPHLGFVKTSRAKAKILHWFKLQDYEVNREEGQQLFDRELRKLGLKNVNVEKIAKSLNYTKTDDFFVALGNGDLRSSQLTNTLIPEEKTVAIEDLVVNRNKSAKQKTKTPEQDISIEGVGNLLTTIARCCKPLPGDDIVGYITQGRGISIHRKDCSNILHANEWQQKRMLSVSWGESTSNRYPVDIVIVAYDRAGLLSDVTTLLTNERAYVLSLTTSTDAKENTAHINVTLELPRLEILSRLLDKITQIPNVAEVIRVT